MKPETEFSLSVLLLAALAVPIHSVAMVLNRWPGIITSLLYVPAVVVASWFLVWRCRAGLHDRPPIALLITLPLATAELFIVGLSLAVVALLAGPGREEQWPSIDTVILPAAKYMGLALTAVLLGLLLRTSRSGTLLAFLTYLALGVSGLLRHAEMRQVGNVTALGEEFPAIHVDWIAFLIPPLIGSLFILAAARASNPNETDEAAHPDQDCRSPLTTRSTS